MVKRVYSSEGDWPRVSVVVDEIGQGILLEWQDRSRVPMVVGQIGQEYLS